MSRHERACPECGCLLTKARSLQDHRRFFSIIQKAYENWNHEHPFQPSSAEHLRAYLLVESNYADPTPIFVELELLPEDARPAALKLVSLAVEATITAAHSKGDYAFARVVGDTITVFRPRSLAFSQLDQKAFGPLREAVEAVIEHALGCKVDQLLRSEAA